MHTFDKSVHKSAQDHTAEFTVTYDPLMWRYGSIFSPQQREQLSTMTSVQMRVEDTPEYKAISQHYEGKVSKRLQYPYMLHINDGLKILRELNATLEVQRAWCLHPFLQAEDGLECLFNKAHTASLSGRAVLLAMQYANVANAHRPGNYHPDAEPELRHEDVWRMLVADKVQNAYALRCRLPLLIMDHVSKQQANELKRYFEWWLERLEIDAVQRKELEGALGRRDYEYFNEKQEGPGKTKGPAKQVEKQVDWLLGQMESDLLRQQERLAELRVALGIPRS